MRRMARVAVLGDDRVLTVVDRVVRFGVMMPGGSVDVLRLGGADQTESKQYRYETHSFPPPQSAQSAQTPQGPTDSRPNRETHAIK